MKELLTFDDVTIKPKMSGVPSRKLMDLSTGIRELKFTLPVISANMDTVTDQNMATAMIRAGAQACLHRFCSIEDNVDVFRQSSIAGGPMVSLGLGEAELDRAKALFDAGAHTFIIDVAHGAQLTVVEQAKALRKLLGPYVNLVVGNFATADSVKDFLDHSGAIVDAFKVGIGPGSACTTRIKTGVGYPQLSAVMEISQLLKNTGVVVIADGGMKVAGDVAKALGAGAHMVMTGGMLAGTNETPGEVVEEKKKVSSEQLGLVTHSVYEIKKFKKYRGSASKESYEEQGKEAAWRTAEGEAFFVPYKGPVQDVLKDIDNGIRSSMGYVGALNLKAFRERCEFVRVTQAGYIEGQAHGKK